MPALPAFLKELDYTKLLHGFEKMKGSKKNYIEIKAIFDSIKNKLTAWISKTIREEDV